MRLFRLASLAVSCVLASWLAADIQHIEIYEYAGHTWPPTLEDSTVIWRNECVAANASTCSDGVKGVAADISAAHGMLEEPVGDKNEDGSRTIRILLHNHADQENDYDPDGAIWLHSGVVGDSLTDYPRKRAIFREMGHAFFDKHVGRLTCQYSCTEAIVEHWGVDEGMARVLASQVGEEPSAPVENAPPSTAGPPPSAATNVSPAPQTPQLATGSTQEEPATPAALPVAPSGSAQPAPCRGCLSGHAALSVVETLLNGLGRKYLDIRAELVVDIPWLTADRRYSTPPRGLPDAPRNYKYGPSAPSTPNLGVSASASVQPARRRLEGIAGLRREAPTTRMGVCGRALRVAAGASRTALRLLGVVPATRTQPRLARNTPAATDAKIRG